jgi:ring-1,2-phenylacetyl-CoA epoxidase subunit PaaE
VKPKFYPLIIKNIERQTRNAVAIELDVPEELRSIFAYKPGQYLTFKHEIDGEEIRRNYSLCSSPLEGKWCVAVKKVPGGLFSTLANEALKPGETLLVMPPLGNFVPNLDATQKKNYLAIAAGSGITPILSIIATTLATEPESNFTLVYGNQSRSSIIFKEALEALKNKYINRLSIYHILSREKTDAALNYGRIDAAKCNELFPRLIDLNIIDEFFLCGPVEMSLSLKEELLRRGVPEKNIYLELFTTGNRGKNKKKNIQNTGDDSPKSKVTIRLDGRESCFDLAYDSDSILDAGIHEGLELPFACKGGMCCTCKAKLLMGEVDMEVHYGLEHDEMEAGYILTCQSHPKTGEVVVDFDDR